MESIVTGQWLKETFDLNSWIASLRDNDHVRMIIDMSLGGVVMLVTENGGTYLV